MAYRVAQSRILPKVMVALAVLITNLAFAQTANGSLAENGAPASEAQFDQWRKQIKKALFIPDPLPQLAPKNYGTYSPADGVVAERVTYGTSYGMRIPAIVYRPSKKQAHLPGLVIVNGHSGDKTSWYAFYSGILYARAGAVVVTYDPIGEDERNSDRKSETGAHDTVVPGEQMPARMGGQMVTDVMQAVSYLVSRSDVDLKRIGVAAYSMGSFHAAIAGAIDPRIHAVVLSGGGNINGPGDYWSKSSKVMCQGGPAKLLDSFLPDKGAVLYALNQRRGPTLIMNGTVDSIVTSVHSDEEFFEGLRALAESLSGTKAGIFETYWFPGAGHRPNFVTRAGAIWLYHQLHFPNWTEESLNSFGEVHVIEWSAKTGAHIGQNFQKELSEGGLRALTTDIPNVPREELQAVPIDEWRQHKDDYVRESWVVRAGAVTN
jgi:dienelactone hydrolase